MQPHAVGADAPAYDVTIIGGGPTGLFAAFYCGMRDMRCQIIDSLPELGGQLSALYPTKDIYDVAGFPAVRAADLVGRLRDQAMAYGPDVRLDEQVTDLSQRVDGSFELATSRGAYRTRSVLLTAGVGAFRPRPLPLKEADRYRDKGVHYHIDDLERFRVKRALVVGGGDSAVDFALMLEAVADEVTVVHRRPDFRAHEASVRKLKASRVRLHTDSQLHAIYGEERVEGVRIVHNATRETADLPVDAIISGLGFVASLGPIAQWGLDIDRNQVVVNSRMETSIPGIYAAGDCATYPGKVKLIATGFGEAATAVNNAKAYLDPDSALSPGHSSDRQA